MLENFASLLLLEGGTCFLLENFASLLLWGGRLEKAREGQDLLLDHLDQKQVPAFSAGEGQDLLLEGQGRPGPAFGPFGPKAGPSLLGGRRPGPAFGRPGKARTCFWTKSRSQPSRREKARMPGPAFKPKAGPGLLRLGKFGQNGEGQDLLLTQKQVPGSFFHPTAKA